MYWQTEPILQWHFWVTKNDLSTFPHYIIVFLPALLAHYSLSKSITIKVQTQFVFFLSASY